MIWKQLQLGRVMGFLVALAAAAGSLTAQDEADRKPPGKGIELRLLAVALLDGDREVVITNGEATSEAVELRTHGFSEPVKAPGRILSITSPPTDGQAGRALAKVTLPSKGRRFLLLLVPSKESYICRVVRLDDPAFKVGHVCFFNVSPTVVAGKLGSRKFIAERGKPVIVAPPDKDNLPYYQVSFYYKRGEQTRSLADTRWPYDARSRSYVFFFPNPKTGRITYRAVDEIVAEGS